MSNKTEQVFENLEEAEAPLRNASYFLPFSRMGIYASMQPIAFNVTLMNPASVLSRIVEVDYYLH